MKDKAKPMEGRVLEEHPNHLYSIELECKKVITAHLGADAKRNVVRLVTGSKVRIRMSQFDPNRGKIIGQSSPRSGA